MYILFPVYREQFTFLYRIGYTETWYNAETTFLKTHDQLANETLQVRYDVRKRWGTISTSLEGSHYFHDAELYHVSADLDLSIRLFEGLSLTFNGNVSKIADQLSIPREDLSEEEILLNRRQQATNYTYNTNIGFRYTFGSIYSNVVNPRFRERVVEWGAWVVRVLRVADDPV